VSVDVFSDQDQHARALRGGPQMKTRMALTTVITGLVSTAVIQVAFSSAIVTGDFHDQEVHFGVSAEVIALTVSLTVCGFG